MRWDAAGALAHIGPGGISSAILTARLVHLRAADATPAIRAGGHVATGAGAKGDGADIILAWLGRSKPPVDAVAARPAAAYAVLALLLRHWNALATPMALREEAETRVMAIAYAACRAPVEAESAGQLLRTTLRWLSLLPQEGPVQRCWQPEQLATLKALLTRFRDAGSTHATALDALVRGEEAAPLWRWGTWAVLGWSVFWGTFLFAFPWSRSVQAAFFWNPQLRRMFSLWFVPLLLFLLPPLRRRLLAPFRDALVAPARLEDLPRLGFFGQTRAQPDRGAPAPVAALLPGLRGTAVLRGDAGLGKSSALRWYAAQSRLPVAFLGARDCAEGVDVAIARRIHNVQETGFVRSLVHTGALTVIVDGLNEVSAATREKISAFAADMTKGHVLIGTQPIEWVPPATARTLDLLPLNRAEAKAFLLSRPIGADPASRVREQAYAAAVEEFLRRNLDDAPSNEERSAAALVLSNPFDLTLAADLLAQGLLPSATALIDEAFRMAEHGIPGEPGYQAVAGQPFPLIRFGQLAVAMRLEDRNWFKPEEFPAELPSLLQRRLLVRRTLRSSTDVEERVLFRHDRVWDFFIAAAFGNDPALWEEHLADPRFRGAYLRIAETWPTEDANRVRDLLVVNAANRGDHTTSDSFIKRLEARRKPGTRRPKG
ncbi:NACHT domain-containing protein [Teichococcus vastitatis]|uniref:ATP-binding protein n=1 Tax=Teichococcus vastitatis TaxID=2307076 RepID=A0ABS9W885_9PROT|nr:hypothetical protein [Pseudoroseomonas vastitatis]MCI0755494.1 hypothetical protein [Pseudoroseomonas vastitatis]